MRANGVVDLAAEPRLVCIPSGDPDMCGVVEHMYMSIPWVTPERLQAALRDIYPDVVVRRRELEGEPMPTWYVFKDRPRPERNSG